MVIKQSRSEDLEVVDFKAPEIFSAGVTGFQASQPNSERFYADFAAFRLQHLLIQWIRSPSAVVCSVLRGWRLIAALSPQEADDSSVLRSVVRGVIPTLGQIILV